MEVDLHTHTTASDGTFTPEELVRSAIKRGVLALAITDHDTVAGVERGKKEAEKYGLEFIEGIEISCNLDNMDIHILGYYLDIYDEKFNKELLELEKARDKRNRKIIENFEKIGIIIDGKELKKFAPGDIISRLHFANYLIDKGVVTTKAEAFTKYLGTGGLCYVPKEDFSPKRAVRMIKENGGIVSLAHPKLITTDDTILENLILSLKECGLDGIEAQYSTFSKEDKKKYKKLAKKFGLLVTGGSDFHGNNREGVEIGSGGVEYQQLERLKKLKNIR